MIEILLLLIIFLPVFGFAKLTGPMFSLEARGKIGNALVNFVWKGRNVLRQWTIPANPQSTAQGDQRIMLGGNGRLTSKCVVTDPYATDMKANTPATNIWNAWYVKYIMDNFFTDSTAYGTERTAYLAHAATTDFDDEADDLGLTEFDLAYATVDPFTAGFQLYMAARVGIALGFTGTCYGKALSTWVLADIQEMVADIDSTA